MRGSQRPGNAAQLLQHQSLSNLGCLDRATDWSNMPGSRAVCTTSVLTVGERRDECFLSFRTEEMAVTLSVGTQMTRRCFVPRACSATGRPQQLFKNSSTFWICFWGSRRKVTITNANVQCVTGPPNYMLCLCFKRMYHIL